MTAGGRSGPGFVGAEMKVLSVADGSFGEAAGVKPGDDLIAIDGKQIRDSLDVAYALGWADDSTEVAFDLVRAGTRLTIRHAPERPESLGMALAEDTYRTCPNKCTFCFVDQLPDGLRECLYVKDEDFRLSFAFGNYITVTNLSEADYARIAEQRLSPLYVSVHATDDGVRRRLLGNPDAPPVLDSLRRLGDMSIDVHAQVVVVPAVNDGSVLEETLDDLGRFCRVRSVAVVPVGLTRYRMGLPEIAPVTSSLAGEIVGRVESHQERLVRSRASRVVFAADELYLLAGRELPPFESYEDFPQMENGVGLLRAFENDFLSGVEALRGRVERPLRVDIVTGVSAAPFLEKNIAPALASAAPITARVRGVANTFLGATVTVAGLLGGSDMAAALGDLKEADLVLLPGEAFNPQGLTLDGMRVDEIAAGSGCGRVVATRDIIEAILEHTAAEGSGPRRESTQR